MVKTKFLNPKEATFQIQLVQLWNITVSQYMHGQNKISQSKGSNFSNSACSTLEYYSIQKRISVIKGKL